MNKKHNDFDLLRNSRLTVPLYADRRELLVFRTFPTVSQRVEMVFRHAEAEPHTRLCSFLKNQPHMAESAGMTCFFRDITGGKKTTLFFASGENAMRMASSSPR